MAYPRGTLIVTADASIFGFLIRLFSGGHYDHVAMALGDGTAIQCIAGKGVTIQPDSQQLDRTLTAMYPGDVERAISFYMSQLNKPYNTLSLLGNPLWNLSKLLGLNWTLPDKGFNCATFMIAPMLSDKIVATNLLKKPAVAYTPSDFLAMFQ